MAEVSKKDDCVKGMPRVVDPKPLGKKYQGYGMGCGLYRRQCKR